MRVRLAPALTYTLASMALLVASIAPVWTGRPRRRLPSCASRIRSSSRCSPSVRLRLVLPRPTAATGAPVAVGFGVVVTETWAVPAGALPLPEPLPPPARAGTTERPMPPVAAPAADTAADTAASPTESTAGGVSNAVGGTNTPGRFCSQVNGGKG